MFRQDALENRKMKWQGRAILLPGIPLWLIMLGSIVFITAFLMFIIVGTYSRRVNVSGEVTTAKSCQYIFRCTGICCQAVCS